MRVLIVCSNAVDSRAERHANVLKQEHTVELLQWDRDEERKKKRSKYTFFRLRAPYDSFTLLFTLPLWNFYLFFTLLFKRFDIVQPTNLDNLLPCLIISKLRRKKIVYDIYDVYGDALTPRVPKFFRNFLTMVERWLLRFVDRLILVDDCRVEQLKLTERMRNKTSIVYNLPIIPKKVKKAKLKQGLQLLYVGLLARNRALPLMVKTVDMMKGVYLTLGGIGADKKLTALIESSRNVSFLGPLPYSKVLELTAASDALIAFYDPKLPNHKYASPNKLFEAMAFGKPIITNTGTNAGSIAEREKMGLVIPYNSQKALEKAITELRYAPKRQELGKNSKSAYRRRYNWKKQREVLLQTYRFSN